MAGGRRRRENPRSSTLFSCGIRPGEGGAGFSASEWPGCGCATVAVRRADARRDRGRSTFPLTRSGSRAGPSSVHPWLAIGKCREKRMPRTASPGHHPKVRDVVRRMTYSGQSSCCHGRGPRFRSARLDRPDREDLAAPDPLRRRAIAQDQAADRPAAARIVILERLCYASERAATSHDIDGRIGQQVHGPAAVRRPGRDEDRSVRLVDEADRDGPQLTRSPAACAEAGEPLVRRQEVVDRRNPLRAAGKPRGRARRGLGSTIRGAGGWAPGGPVGLTVRRRQRLRCQDLPSVATDGA